MAARHFKDLTVTGTLYVNAVTGLDLTQALTGAAAMTSTGTGGAISLTGGTGGSTSGAGGAASLVGGAASAGNSVGGASSVTGGAGSGSSAGGAVTVTGGAGGATGAGGAITITSGAGGATSGAAGAVTIQGGTPVDGAGGTVSITGSAGVGTNRSGGSVVLTAGAATGTGTAGVVIAKGSLDFHKRTASNLTTAGNQTLTTAQFLSGFLTRDPNGGNVTDTTPTAAAIVAAVPNAEVGTSFFMVIKNTADAAETITVAGGTGVTITGTATIAQNNTKIFLVRLDNVTASSEAVTLYSIGTLVH